MGWVIKPQLEFNVFAHDLMRETKGLEWQIDRKRYIQRLAVRLISSLHGSNALSITTAAGLVDRL